MTKFTKLPEEIDAVQWFKDGDRNDPLYREAEEFFSPQRGRADWIIQGDWIVKKESGAHVILSDKDFRRTYKLSEDKTPPTGNYFVTDPVTGHGHLVYEPSI